MNKSKRKRTATHPQDFDPKAWLEGHQRYSGCRICQNPAMLKFLEPIMAHAKTIRVMVPVVALHKLLSEKFPRVSLSVWIVGQHLRKCCKHGRQV